VVNIIKRYLKFVGKKYYEAFLYIMSIVRSTIYTMAIMPPVCLFVQWFMELCGVNFGASILQSGNVEVIQTIFNEMGYAGIAVLCFGIGMAEEVYFRYLINDCFLSKFMQAKYWVAVALSSLLFGAAHMVNAPFPLALPQSIGAVVAGFWFAHLYKKHGLHHVIFTHALYDFVVISLSILFTGKVS
jgi:membrane protease YdiL (CAAX protease family)